MIGHRALKSQHMALGKSLEKLSSGLRINRAADDAAGLSVSEGMRARFRGIDMAKNNAGDGIAMLQIAEGAAGEINNILQRMRELAIQSATDTMTTVERSYTDREFLELMRDIDRISGSTFYSNLQILNGGTDSFGSAGSAFSILHIGPEAGASGNRINVTVTSTTSGALGLSSGVTPVYVSISTSAGALSSLSLIDTALKSVNTLRSDLGAYVNRLEFSVSMLTSQFWNEQDAESRIRDVDFAKESTEFTRAQILVQSATSMLAQANQVPQGVLSLLGR